jgi:hypothetical protein
VSSLILRSLASAVVLTLGAGVIACGGREAADDSEPAAAAPLEAPDALTITTNDGAIDLALANDTVAFRLSEKTMAKVRTSTDTAAVRASGVGGWIEKTVKSTVQSALSGAFRVPVSEIEDARYEDGRIVLELRGKGRFDASDIEVNDRPLLESFPPDDARRFVDAVRARIAR